MKKEKLCCKMLILIILAMCVNAQASILDLKVTEIMYHPKPDIGQVEKDLEFIELKNTGADTLNLKTLVLFGGAQFVFSSDLKVAPNEFVVLVSDSNVFHQRYPSVKVGGEFTSNFANSGEEFYIKAGNDTLINIEYGDDLPWSPLADGKGFSLVSNDVNPVGKQDKSNDWKNSCAVNGSPGTDDPACTNFPDVWINELLSHTDLPQVDAIEIFNNSLTEADISGWYLSDSKSNPYKFKIPENTNISAGSYYLIDETQFNISGSGFRFNRSGDEIYLFSGNNSNELTGFVTGWEFEAQYNGVSFGVHITSENEKYFVAQKKVTLGAPNTLPKVGPLVISRINYHPEGNEEYLIITNIADTTVDLWHSATPDSGWVVSGVNFKFPAGVSLGSGGEIVLSNVPPAQLGLSAGYQAFMYAGKLSDSGETIAIWSYDRMDTTNLDAIFMPRVLMDQVNYDDKSPWPILADGYGYNLQKKVLKDYGNDPANWTDSSWILKGIEEALAQKIKGFYQNGNFYFENLNNYKGKLSVFSLNGKLIESLEVTKAYNVINAEQWSDGVYLYNFQTKASNLSVKFIKH